MRISIRARYEFAIDITVARSPSDTREEAHRTARELADELSVALVDRAEVRTPQPLFAHKPKRPISLTVRPVSIEEPYQVKTHDGTLRTFVRHHVQPPDTAGRLELLTLIEGVASQYLEQVDVMPSLAWCLKPIRSKDSAIKADLYNKPSTNEIEELGTIDAEYVAARERLLEPYYAGKSPVVHNELFYEFYHDLTLLEQRLILMMKDNKDGIDAQALSSYRAGKQYQHLTNPPREWRKISAQLLEKSWAVKDSAKPALGYRYLPYNEPRLVCAKKSRLLPASQMIV